MTQKQRVMQGNSAVERALAALMKWMEPVTRKLYKLLGQMCTSDDDVLAVSTLFPGMGLPSISLLSYPQVAAFRTGVHLLTEWDPLQRQITKLQRLLALLEPSVRSASSCASSAIRFISLGRYVRNIYRRRCWE